MPHTGSAWLDFGAANLLFGSTDLGATVTNPNGGTHGGVRLRIRTDLAQSMRDAKGTQPHGGVYQGTVIEIEALLAGASREQLAALIPGAALSAGPTSKAMTLSSCAGIDVFDVSETLTIKPLVGVTPSTDPDDWALFYEAAPQVDAEVAFELATQKIFKVTFLVFGDSNLVLAKFGINDT